jgi:hypothetical protein
MYSLELIEDITTNQSKKRRPGVVADLRARAVQRKANASNSNLSSSHAAMSEEEQMERRERLELMKKSKNAMDSRLGRLVVVQDEDSAESRVIAAAAGKTGTKSNLDLEIEAIQARAVQAARAQQRELLLASSSRLRAVGHIPDRTMQRDCSAADIELLLESLRSYNLNIPPRDAICERIQEALKSPFYFAPDTSQEQDFFVYSLQNSGKKAPFIVDLCGCSLSELAGSALGLMMSTPMNQLTALHARNMMISRSSWRFMCDGVRLSQSLSVLDVSFARGAPQSEDGMAYFCSSIKKNVSLIEISAQGLPLGLSNHAALMAEAVGTHVRLRKLDFSDCCMSDESMNVNHPDACAFLVHEVLRCVCA